MSLFFPEREQAPGPRRGRGKTALAAALGATLAFAPLAGFVPSAALAATLSTAAPSSAVSGLPLPSFAPLVKRVLPAVVNISVIEKPGADPEADGVQQQSDQGQPFPGFPPSPFDQFLRKFFEQQQQQGGQAPHPGVQRIALGSGFIIDPKGYVVTNNHVVVDAEKVTVIFQDGSKHPAKVLGRDTKTDLALLKIETKKPLPYVSWGDSNDSHVGDWVLAVGNPFGLGGTVSSGIISARGRDINEGPYDDFLQLDAAINRGNSGGPTFNLQGQVIGINTAIYTPNGGSVGIGFAIPSSLAKPVIEQLKEHGKVERGWLGVQIQHVTPEIAKGLGLSRAEGALVADLTKDSPAAKAGVKQGDVILSFDGHGISKMRDLPIIVADTPIGKKVSVEVWRDGKKETLDVGIGKMPSNPQLAENGGGEQGEAGEAKGLGLTFAPLTATWRQRLHVEKNVMGAVVTAVADNSPLAALGIQQGDVIEQIDRKPIDTPRAAVAALEEAQKEKGPSRSLLILLNRHGVNQYVAMTVNAPAGNG